MCTRDPKHVVLCPKPVCVSGGPRWNRSVAREPESLSDAHVTLGAQCPLSRCVPATFHSASVGHFAFRTCFCGFLSRDVDSNSSPQRQSLEQPVAGAVALWRSGCSSRRRRSCGPHCCFLQRCPLFTRSQVPVHPSSPLRHCFSPPSEDLCTLTCVCMRTRLPKLITTLGLCKK